MPEIPERRVLSNAALLALMRSSAATMGIFNKRDAAAAWVDFPLPGGPRNRTTGPSTFGWAFARPQSIAAPNRNRNGLELPIAIVTGIVASSNPGGGRGASGWISIGFSSAFATLGFVPQNLYDLDPGPNSPEIVRMIVEIPKGATNKYEYDGGLGVFRLDRALYSPMHYPGDYGFIPGTLAEDRDPMDVLVLVQESSFTGCMIEVRPVGILSMTDSEEHDQKVLAVPNRNPRYDQIHTMDQIFAHVRREIEHFFTIYKELEGKQTRIEGWQGPIEARRAIVDARKMYLEAKAKLVMAANPG